MNWEILDRFYQNFIQIAQGVNWNNLKNNYRNFLRKIPLRQYRQSLQNIKTIEFDLSGKYRSLHLSMINHY